MHNLFVIEKTFIPEDQCMNFSNYIRKSPDIESYSKSNWLNFENSISKTSSTKIHKNKFLNLCLKNILEYHSLNFGKISEESGFEWWVNIDRNQDWHIDKDEVLFQRMNKIHPAQRSYLLYLEKPISGGELEICTAPSLIPFTYLHNSSKILGIKTGMLLHFNSLHYHRVLPFKGGRISIALNFWNRPPLSVIRT